ncbi:MAG: tyrosine-type recombinase/integrase [Planctomycetota bacterium]
MPRPSKPYLRKQTRSWYCSIEGRQIPLGKDRAEAFEKFHALMADKSSVQGEVTTLYGLSGTYLDWCLANRKRATYERHRHYLKRFIESVGRRLRPSQLKVHHVVRWHEGLGVGSTTQNDAVAIVQRMLNWAVEQQHLSRNPVKGMAKPARKRRDVCYSSAQRELILATATEPARTFLRLLFLTGCRPLEARSIEARHLHDDLVIFPADESKGGRDSRVVFLPTEAKAILDPLASEHPSGPLFRNARGRPWTKDAIKCQLTRISEKVGFRVIAYGARHSYATSALTAGVDSTAVGHLMGHRDTTMVHRVYGHLTKNPDFLREQARRAISED